MEAERIGRLGLEDSDETMGAVVLSLQVGRLYYVRRV